MHDISTLFDNSEPLPDGKKVDLSGKPAPVNVRAVLDSGLEIPCTTVYDGQAQDNMMMRRYKVMAEIDWSNYWIKTLLVDECPLDVRLIVAVPDVVGDAHRAYAMQMQTIIRKRV